MQPTRALEPLRDGEVLEFLVRQYGTTFVCFREFVQNAIDAGSEELDVRVNFVPGDQAEGGTRAGLVEIVVEDQGEGMGRELIEGRLTTLFASVGDDEPGTIGRYGVGFVSVFALAPELVLVDSSWQGEAWRVAFDAQGQYTLRRRATALYGTVIRIYKATTLEGADTLRDRVRAALKHWCEHAPIVVRLEGERISQPMTIDAPCCVTVRSEDAEIVMAHTPAGQASTQTLYRRGLTLFQGPSEDLDGVTIKISSPLFDRALTSNAVIRDTAHDRLLARLREIADTRLCERVFEMLEAHVWSVVQGDVDAERAQYLYGAAVWHVKRARELPPGVDDRSAFRSPAGLAIGLSAVVRALARRGVVYFHPERTPLTDALEDQGHLVVRLSRESPGYQLLQAVDTDDRAVAVFERFCMPLPLSEAEFSRWRPLTMAVAQLVVDFGGEITGVEAAHFDYDGSPLAQDVVISQEHPGELSRVEKVRGEGLELFTRIETLVINADHPAIKTFASLATSEPEFAAYQFMKLVFLGIRLEPELEAALAGLTVERRWKRRSR